VPRKKILRTKPFLVRGCRGRVFSVTHHRHSARRFARVARSAVTCFTRRPSPQGSGARGDRRHLQPSSRRGVARQRPRAARARRRPRVIRGRGGMAVTSWLQRCDISFRAVSCLTSCSRSWRYDSYFLVVARRSPCVECVMPHLVFALLSPVLRLRAAERIRWEESVRAQVDLAKERDKRGCEW
jgi:hypothetical protein